MHCKTMSGMMVIRVHFPQPLTATTISDHDSASKIPSSVQHDDWLDKHSESSEYEGARFYSVVPQK